MNASPLRTASRPGGRAANGSRGTVEDRMRQAEVDRLRESASRLRSVGNAALATEVEPERQQATRPRLRLAPPVPVTVARTPFVVLVVLMVVAGVMGILVLNNQINENAFKIESLRKQQSTLDLREQQLNQQIADYESPGSLAAAARKLGLVPAGAPAFILLPDGKIIGVPQPASGAPSVTSQ